MNTQASTRAGESLSPELEARLHEVEAAAAMEPGFVGIDWVVLAVTGVIAPVLLLWWGWHA